MSLEEVLPGVYVIDFQLVNCFLIADEELTLIDTGMPRRIDRLADALSQLGRSPSDLRHLALTHYHEDHMGNVAQLAAHGATVYAHPADAPVICGQRDRPPLPDGAAKTLEPVAHLLKDPETTQVHREIVDGDLLPFAGGVRVIHTPGHTAGHVAYLMESKKVLFVGDAAANASGLVPPPFSDGSDIDVRRSIERLAGLDFDIACFGHGAVLRDQAVSAFRKLVEHLAA